MTTMYSTPTTTYNYAYGYGSSMPYDWAIQNRPFSQSLGSTLFGGRSS
jgi:hypothetical protein